MKTQKSHSIKIILDLLKYEKHFCKSKKLKNYYIL